MDTESIESANPNPPTARPSLAADASRLSAIMMAARLLAWVRTDHDEGPLGATIRLDPLEGAWAHARPLLEKEGFVGGVLASDDPELDSMWPARVIAVIEADEAAAIVAWASAESARAAKGVASVLRDRPGISDGAGFAEEDLFEDAAAQADANRLANLLTALRVLALVGDGDASDREGERIRMVRLRGRFADAGVMLDRFGFAGGTIGGITQIEEAWPARLVLVAEKAIAAVLIRWADWVAAERIRRMSAATVA